jgi:plasmid maintenance system antidote protein VapI
MRIPSPLLELSSYDPNPLLDRLKDFLEGRQDTKLAEVLGVTKSKISKIRHKHLGVNAEMLLRMHEISGLSIRELRTLMGDSRRYF